MTRSRLPHRLLQRSHDALREGRGLVEKLHRDCHIGFARLLRTQALRTPGLLPRAAPSPPAAAGSAELALRHYRTGQPPKRAGMRAPPRTRGSPGHIGPQPPMRDPSGPRHSSMTLKIPQRHGHAGDLVVGRGAVAAVRGRFQAALPRLRFPSVSHWRCVGHTHHHIYGTVATRPSDGHRVYVWFTSSPEQTM